MRDNVGQGLHEGEHATIARACKWGHKGDYDQGSLIYFLLEFECELLNCRLPRYLPLATLMSTVLIISTRKNTREKPLKTFATIGDDANATTDNDPV